MSWQRQGLTFRPVARGDLDLLRQHRNDSAGSFRDPMHAWAADQDAWFRSLSRERQAFMVLDEEQWETASDPTLPKHMQGQQPVNAVAERPIRVGLLRFSDYDWINRSVGFTGCDVFIHARGRGYATRICKAAAEYAFEEWGLHRIWGQATQTNEPMLRALRAAGYRDEARFRGALWRGGRYIDFLQLSRLAEDSVPTSLDILTMGDAGDGDGSFGMGNSGRVGMPVGMPEPGPYYEPDSPPAPPHPGVIE